MSKEVDDLANDYNDSDVNATPVTAHTDSKRKRRLNLRSMVKKNEIRDIKLGDIDVGEQPRKFFDDDRLEELAASIKDRGQLEPIKVVATQGEKKPYRLIFGERRFRASQLIAGKATISALVYGGGLTDRDVILDQMAENVHREDLHPIEKAQGLFALLSLPQLEGTKNAELAKMVQKSESYVSRLLTLNQLSGEYQDLLLLNAQTFSAKFIYDELPPLINQYKNKQDDLCALIVDSVEAKQNLLSCQREVVKRVSIKKKSPGRKKQEQALDLNVLKSKIVIGLKTGQLKKLKGNAQRCDIVGEDVQQLIAGFKSQLRQRLEPHFSDVELAEILDRQF